MSETQKRKYIGGRQKKSQGISKSGWRGVGKGVRLLRTIQEVFVRQTTSGMLKCLQMYKPSYWKHVFIPEIEPMCVKSLTIDFKGKQDWTFLFQVGFLSSYSSFFVVSSCIDFKIRASLSRQMQQSSEANLQGYSYMQITSQC